MSYFKSKLRNIKKSRAESKAFAKIVNERTLRARREAYKKEALKQAEIKGRELAVKEANKPSLGQRFSGFANEFAGSTQSLSRQPVRRRVVRKSKPVRVVRRKRRRTVRRQSPVRVVRRKRRRTVRRQSPVRQDFNAPSVNWGF